MQPYQAELKRLSEELLVAKKKAQETFLCSVLQNEGKCWAEFYRVSQEECAILRESVPYVELYRYNPKHLYPKLNGYGDNGQRSLKL